MLFIPCDYSYANQRDIEKQKIEDTIEQGSGDFDIKDSAVITGSLKVDTIDEEQSGVGVTVDGTLIKDGSFGGDITGDSATTSDSTVVRTTGDQSIGGVKTFTSTISGDITGDSATTSDSSVVRTTGNQSIGGTKTFTDGITGPGSVPIGGMVAVMPHVSGSWQPPASGAVKDGFMRADGSVVSDGDSPLNGQTLPNMTGNTYARGDITSSSVSGGANTQASNVTVGNHTALALNNHTALAPNNHTFTNPTMPKHYHSATASASNDLTAAGQSYTGSSTHGHFTVHNALNNSSTLDSTSEAISHEANDLIGGHTSFPNVGRTSETSVVISHTHGSSAVSGYAGCQGVSGCVSGDTDTQTTGGGVSAHGFSQNITAHSFSQNIDAHTVTNNAVNNEPKYLSVVWVIRVK
jgi:hypothetical protein